ncbi:hypothetical protein KGM48_03680 [Patescibacteria group bacterium]|nr:hypothetical protein [Patescibacteria group bacterium]
MYVSLIVNVIALLFSFFVIGLVLGIAFSKPLRKKIFTLLRIERIRLLQHLLVLNKSHYNPILKPGSHPWTAEAVLNPAAAVIGGRTHLIYRAIGMDGVSRLGYASSSNGIVFDQILPYPVYVARNPHNIARDRRYYSPMLYPSGGSWGGCEDPRMVVIDGWVYVTFNMFDNWTLRVAVIALREEDFLAKRFYLWEGPIILSHGTRDKNWVLFPEKIHGQFAVLHSIIGPTDDHVRIEYTSDLATLSRRRFISPDPQKIPDKQIAWHVHTRSAGPPPLRTDKGWLVLYHANDAHESNRYKIGAMLLDINDPSQILHRAAAPVISPDSNYENHGKPGIVYACGSVVRNGILYVYYGGADRVVCVATAHLNTFLDALIEGSQPALEVMLPVQTA